MVRIIIIIIYLFLIVKYSFAKERYVCTQDKDNTKSLITNFYVSEDNIVMSGAVGNGNYKVLEITNNGILAINSSIIGNEFGLETILLDSFKKVFSYKSLISGKSRKKLMKMKGNCNIFK